MLFLCIILTALSLITQKTFCTVIATIDGPAASGKTTLGSLLAKKKHVFLIDSGMLMRALAYSALKNNAIDHLGHLSEDDITQLFLDDLTYGYSPDKGPVVFYGSEDISDLIKTPRFDKLSAHIAAIPVVQHAIHDYAKALVTDQDVILSGQATASIFPKACSKFYLTSSIKIRAERWVRLQRALGKIFTLREAEKILSERDKSDLQWMPKPGPEALIFDNTTVSLENQLTTFLNLLDYKKC